MKNHFIFICVFDEPLFFTYNLATVGERNYMKNTTKTKIIATLGPSTSNSEKIKELILAGASMFRLNTSHGKEEDHAKNIKLIRENSDLVKEINNNEKYYLFLDELQEIRRALQAYMAEEEASGLHHWFGEYMPSDALTEAMIELNTIIYELNELLEEL